jgi:hypothetical protein
MPDGERVDVPYDDIVEVLPRVWPPHVCRGEPDASLSDWVFSRLWHDETVASMVPGDFEAVARIYHPFNPYDDPVPWSTVMAHEHVADRRALIDLIYNYYDFGDFETPYEREIEPTPALVEVLRAATATPEDVLFAVWHGWGGESWDRFPNAALIDKYKPTFRPCRFLRGPVDGALHVNPMVWWPADRAWVVHTEIDAVTTLVAGREAMIEALLARPELEATRTSFDAGAYEPD